MNIDKLKKSSLSIYETYVDMPSYIFISVFISLFTVFLIGIISQISLFQTIIFADYLSIQDRFYLLYSMLPFANTYTISYDILVVFVSILTGLNITILFRIYNIGEFSIKGSSYSSFGIILSFLSVGCVACGAAAISGIIALITGISLLAILPYGGIEFLVISCVLLIISAYFNGLILSNSRSCEIN